MNDNINTTTIMKTKILYLEIIAAAIALVGVIYVHKYNHTEMLLRLGIAILIFPPIFLPLPKIKTIYQ